MPKWRIQLPKLWMGGWNLTHVHIHTQKILHTSIRFLWLTSFFWTSKNVRWSNNKCCSKVKLIWKLIFPGHFVTSLVPITEVRFNLSKQQDVNSAVRSPNLCNRMAFQQLIWLYQNSTWFILSQYPKDINKQIYKNKFSKLGCC